MDLFRMRCFVSVAENKSLSKAAREVFISQPAMTAQMNALEKELGAQLLVHGHSTAITSTGELVLTSFRSMLSEYDDLLRGVHESEAATRGRIVWAFMGLWAGETSVRRFPNSRFRIRALRWRSS